MKLEASSSRIDTAAGATASLQNCTFEDNVSDAGPLISLAGGGALQMQVYHFTDNKGAEIGAAQMPPPVSARSLLALRAAHACLCKTATPSPAASHAVRPTKLGALLFVGMCFFFILHPVFAL